MLIKKRIMLTDKQIKESKQVLKQVCPAIKEKSCLCYIGSDPTRLSILFLLSKNKGLCVTDLANILDVSVSAISHQLKILEDCGFVQGLKTGKTVCCLVIKSKKVGLLLKSIK